MRPATIRDAAGRIAAGEPRWKALGEFLDRFYTAQTSPERIAMLADEPQPSDDPHLDTLLGGIAEYLYKRWTRREPPTWMSEQRRYLAEPWFATPLRGPGILEYLTFVSPPEFKSRNIMTDETPLRRATCAETDATRGHDPARGETRIKGSAGLGLVPWARTYGAFWSRGD